jgi:hypothetical protein
MNCRYCDYNLDNGDIYQVLSELDEYKKLNSEEISITARAYGWTPNNKKRFNKIVIIQFDNKPQIEVCPKCSGIWPNNTNMPKEYYKE